MPTTAKISYLDSFIHKVTVEDIMQYIYKNSVTHLVLSMSSIVWSDDFDTLVNLRKKFPNLKISVFGDVFQELFFVKQVLPQDVTIIRHPLDVRIAEYFNSGNIITSSLLADLNGYKGQLPPVEIQQCVEFPLPRHEIFLNRKYRSPFNKYKRNAIVNINWGCPYACSYCSWSSPYLPFVYKSAQSMLRELELLHRLKVKEIFFGDLNFGVPQDVTWDIVNAMLRNNWRFSWHCYVRPGSLSRDMLTLMRKAGCHTVITGVESFDSDLVRFNRKVNLNDIQNTISICHRLGMDVCGDFIVGLNTSADDWKKMAKFAIGLGLDYASFNVYTPMLGSRERAQKISAGIIHEGEWGFDTTGSKKSLVEHSENRLQCVKMFYGRPSYWLKRLLKLRTIDELFIKLEEGINILKKLW